MIAILIGTALGFLSGLGIGGGSLLILWLTLAESFDLATARGINLLFFLPSALIAAACRWKQGSLPVKKILPAIICGCISAFVFSLLFARIDGSLLQRIFGGLLILTGVREKLYRPKPKREGP